nr:MAG TPA: hypothetical protein [Caudoviricetes sp.]
MTAGRVSLVKRKPLVELPLLIGCQRTVLIRDVFPDFLFCRILGFFHVGLLHRPWALSLSPVYDDMFAISPQTEKIAPLSSIICPRARKKNRGRVLAERSQKPCRAKR